MRQNEPAPPAAEARASCAYERHTALDAYDPEPAPSAANWLALDETERIDLVSSYHGRKKIRLPNSQLHAVIHVIVENQLALRESVVVDTLARLQSEGLSRHDALHAVGSAPSRDLDELVG